MTDIRHFFSAMLLGTMLLSCSEAEVSSDAVVKSQLAFSVSQMSQQTRQGLDVVQENPNDYRGIDHLDVMSFITASPTTPVAVTDEPLEDLASGTEADRVSGKEYYYLDEYMLKSGTNRVLVYGQAKAKSGKDSNTENGKLNTTLNGVTKPADITFSLESICKEDNAGTGVTDPDRDEEFDPAWNLANYLTTIANTPGWSENADLKNRYLNFIHADTDGSGLICGSAAHIKAYVKALKQELQAIKVAEGTSDDTKALCTTIIENIGNTEDATSCVNNGYPGTLGLPDAAAVLRWIGSENRFRVLTKASTLDNINDVTRYAYPAELWYYVNSGVCTSENPVTKVDYKNSSNWEALLAEKYTAGPTVNNHTRSVAVESPLQYGVARLKMILEPITGGDNGLKDAKDEVIVAANTTANYPLTGVVIGAQYPVGFDFKPLATKSDDNKCFIYDTVVGDKDTETGKWTVNTLVLQTYEEERVPVILELTNPEDGTEFTGRDGVVYPGTKFYLIGMANGTDEGYGTESYNRVFTQDFITQLTLKVNSLANAYTCMPDLKQPRLEVGVEVKTKWIQSTTTTVILD